MADIIVEGATIVTMNPSRQLLRDGAVAVSENRIIDVGPREKIARLHKAGRIFGGHNKIVLPGLVNLHTHNSEKFVPGLADDLNLYAWLEKVINPMMLNLTEEDCYWTSLLAQIEMIRSGVTCFSDHFDVMIGKIFPQLIAAVEKSGMRGVLSREIFSKSDLPDQLAMSVSDDIDRQMLADTVETIEKLRDRQSRASVRLGLGGVSYASESLIETVRSLATRLKVGIHVHAAESTDEVRFFKRKKKTTPLRYACDVGLLGPDVVLAHCVWVNSEEIRMLRQTDAKVAYSPVSNMKLADGVAPVWKMLEEGVTVGLGTDGAASNDNLDMFACMKLGSYLQKIHSLNPSRLSSLKMLEIATIGGAKALQMDDQIGSIEPGKKADLTIVDLNQPNMTPANDLAKQLVCCCTPSCVDTVIIDGNAVLEGGRFTQLDEAAVVTEAKARATSLVERMHR